jgi:hypothetical protein
MYLYQNHLKIYISNKINCQEPRLTSNYSLQNFISFFYKIIFYIINLTNNHFNYAKSF